MRGGWWLRRSKQSKAVFPCPCPWSFRESQQPRFESRLLAPPPCVNKLQHELLNVAEPFSLELARLPADVAEMPALPHIARHILVALRKRQAPAVLGGVLVDPSAHAGFAPAKPLPFRFGSRRFSLSQVPCERSTSRPPSPFALPHRLVEQRARAVALDVGNALVRDYNVFSAMHTGEWLFGYLRAAAFYKTRFCATLGIYNLAVFAAIARYESWTSVIQQERNRSKE